ncbi:dockerin type I domain-containing protein [Lacipirellula parvula]|uniref:Dockerin domain-containing protein n=1 Tax=Lacipirellula parvula TaxID=2650471 RepID=A0A5K7XF00_9BACT|nr:dockerin type I domain-containing protein [Lacipirellula parvula]BBO34627.1 hypothetical protein PLANPX_4239 [Lacipirellula parvula]
MKRLLPSCLIACSLIACVISSPVRAQNLLLNGDLEVQSIEVPNWTLQEFRTGSSAEVNSVTREGFANQPASVTGEYGIWLRPWAAGDTSTEMVNGVISQIVPGVASENYTFTGWSKFEQNYAGGVTNLDFFSPLDPGQTGTVPSPTNTLFEMAFLDASNSVIGTPITMDLRTARGPVPNNNTWIQHTLSGAAPAGTANIRVSASMLNGVFNTNPSQSAFVDNFSLTGSSAPTTEKLANPNFNLLPPEFPGSFTLTESPSGRDTAGGASFANRQAPGANGVWLKAFSGSLADPSDATLSQTVAATVGGNYTFSAWSKWETNYSGGLAAISGSPSPTQTLIELAFLDAGNVVIGTPVTVNLKTAGQLNDNTWRQYSVNGIAPAGAVNVRVSAIMNDGVNSGANPQSAFFDDLSLTLAAAPANDADFNNDGIVDGKDFLIWQRGFGTAAGATNGVGDANADGAVNAADLTVWKDRFGQPSAAAAVQAVPEPASLAGACVALALIGYSSRGQRGRRSN